MAFYSELFASFCFSFLVVLWVFLVFDLGLLSVQSLV